MFLLNKSLKKDALVIIKNLAKKISDLELDLPANNGPAEGFYKTNCRLPSATVVGGSDQQLDLSVSLPFPSFVIVCLACFPVKKNSLENINKLVVSNHYF